MVRFITKNDKIIPISENRTPFAQPEIASHQVLPKTESNDDDKLRQSKRALVFAGKKVKTFASITRATGERLKNRQIQKSIDSRRETQTLDREIDDILDDTTSSDSRKFRLLQRFGLLHRKRLSKSELKVVNTSLMELDERIVKNKEKGVGGMTTPKETSTFTPKATSTFTPRVEDGLTQDQFNKLPDNLKEQIRAISVS